MPEIKLNEDQLKAVERSMSLKLSVVNGGAGVGKTTVIQYIVKALSGSGEVVLVCPTGKAAARLREASGFDTSTIHRMLGYNGVGFSRTTLEGVIVIVDEASMVDSKLMAEIVSRNPKRLILVGDEAQLMPVDSGSPFHDIIRLRPELVTTLSICYRNSEAIYKAAMCIRNGNRPLRYDKSGKEIWETLQISDNNTVQETIMDWVKDNHIDFTKDIVLCPKNGKKVKVEKDECDEADDTPGTVYSFNQSIIKHLNNREENQKWAVGDRIICLKNFSNIDTWNGTTGTITGIESTGRQKGSLYVKGDIPFWDDLSQNWFEQINWPLEVVGNCQHAYALTVHKSQGSQYDNVIFFSRKQDSFSMFNRSLLYTAVTRAKKSCTIMGDIYSFMGGIQKHVKKTTVLQQLALTKEG